MSAFGSILKHVAHVVRHAVDAVPEGELDQCIGQFPSLKAKKGTRYLIPCPAQAFANFAIGGTELTLIAKCPLLNLPLIHVVECEPKQPVSTEPIGPRLPGFRELFPEPSQIEVEMSLSK